jgi:hypothetical protein
LRTRSALAAALATGFATAAACAVEFVRTPLSAHALKANNAVPAIAHARAKLVLVIALPLSR